MPGVFAVSPTLATTVTLVHKKKAENVAMIGIDPLEGDKISDVSKSMIQSRKLAGTFPGGNIPSLQSFQA
jgi:ABC-type lipoprotein release transport system permease subunit